MRGDLNRRRDELLDQRVGDGQTFDVLRNTVATLWIRESYCARLAE